MFNKSCRWLDSNPGPLVSEATALPTAPQPLPNDCPYAWCSQHRPNNCLEYFYSPHFDVEKLISLILHRRDWTKMKKYTFSFLSLFLSVAQTDKNLLLEIWSADLSWETYIGQERERKKERERERERERKRERKREREKERERGRQPTSHRSFIECCD